MLRSFIQDESPSIRLDSFLSQKMAEYSRNYIQKLISSSSVKVNAEIVLKNSFKLKLQDKIEISLPPEEEHEIKAENIPLHIVFQDSALSIIDKPEKC